MKKKITQWFIGLVYSIMGAGSIFFMVILIINFMNMMETTGGEFIENFIFFVLHLIAFIFYPYMVFHEIRDGVQDRWK